MPSRRSPHARSIERTTFEGLARFGRRAPGGTLERLRRVRVAEGSVRVDRRNLLRYEVEAAEGRGGVRPQHAVVLDGTWGLTRSHDLTLALHQAAGNGRETLYLRGALLKAEVHALIFTLQRSASEHVRMAQRLTLSGRWSVDARNRLSFLVDKGGGEEDRLVFQGGWEVGPHHELRYRMEPRRRGREAHVLAFDGAWDIAGSDRLVYRLSGAANAAFEFRAALQSRSLLAREGRIVYQVGIGLSQGRLERRRVALFGTWKLNRDLSVSFEVPYAGGRVQAIRFEGTAALSGRDHISVALSTRRGESLGITVTFTRDLVPDAGLFLRLRRDAEETSAIGGVQVRF
jgi:hypothetical protein